MPKTTYPPIIYVFQVSITDFTLPVPAGLGFGCPGARHRLCSWQNTGDVCAAQKF